MLDTLDNFWWNSHLDNLAEGIIMKSPVDEVLEKYMKPHACVPAVLEYLTDGTPVRTLFAVKEVKHDVTHEFDWTIRVELHAPHLPHNPSGVLYYDERGYMIDQVF
jgi:hypothetical protein